MKRYIGRHLRHQFINNRFQTTGKLTELTARFYIRCGSLLARCQHTFNHIAMFALQTVEFRECRIEAQLINIAAVNPRQQWLDKFIHHFIAQVIFEKIAYGHIPIRRIRAFENILHSADFTGHDNKVDLAKGTNSVGIPTMEPPGIGNILPLS